MQPFVLPPDIRIEVSHSGSYVHYNIDRIPIPPTIMAKATTFRTIVSLSNGSFRIRIFWMLNRLLIKNTKNGLVAAKAATNDIAPISVALVSEIDATVAIKKSAASIKSKVRPFRTRTSNSRNPFGLARTLKAQAIAADRIAYVIQTVSPLSRADFAKMCDNAVSKLATIKIGNARENLRILVSHAV